MKKQEIYFLEVLLFISIIVFNIFYKNFYLLHISIVLIGIYFIKRFGIMKDNNYLKTSTTKIVISCILSYFVTIYIIGLLTSYHKTTFSLNIQYLFNSVLIESVTIIIEELIRYIICRNTQHKKTPIVFYTIILIVLNIIIEINGYDLSDNESLFIFITTVVLPISCKEAVCSYLTYKVSYIPSMIYKLTTYLYGMVLPIVPNIGNYLYATTNIALPYFIYFFVSKTLHYNDKAEIYQKKVSQRVLYVPIFVCLIVLVILISGVFTNTLISIGSNSMKPSYERGDAVIYHKTNIKDIKIGEVIAFRRQGIIITHRVIDIYKSDTRYTFKTKGDANNAPDAYVIEGKDVLGVVKYSIKYLGYPTLWFNDLFTGKETS